MKKYVWPLLIIFFLLGGLAAILIGQVALPPEPRPQSVEEIGEAWSASGHADFTSESFVHWDEDDPAEVPVNCAKCHSANGYLDYLGEDGSEALVVDEPAAVGSVVSCYVCHNPTASEKDSTIYPSGAVISDLGMTANCTECHQGRTSKEDVENAVLDLPEDEVNDELGFINVHYKIAGAVRFGAQTAVGYEYPGQEYAGYFEHVTDYQDCTDCHDAHSLSINPTECSTCHANVSGFADLLNIRESDTPDYDGDGDTVEGVYYEMDTLHDLLYAAIQQYASEVAGTPILYADSYPYWFIDTNGNGTAEEDELSVPNQYASWTPRLLKAAYNYHLVLEDPGGFMHNAAYLIQLMYDGIADLNTMVAVDMDSLVRPE
jgi:hypothetical protein